MPYIILLGFLGVVIAAVMVVGHLIVRETNRVNHQYFKNGGNEERLNTQVTQWEDEERCREASRDSYGSH